MPTLRERVERALAEEPRECGLAVFGPDMRLLAERDALPGGGHQLVFLTDGEERIAWRP